MPKDYYESCPFPKPVTKKKKKKTNGWKEKKNRICYYTGEPFAERHEVFYGNGLRQISIDHGFQVDLCPQLHREVHAQTAEGQRITKYWRKYYQKHYMQKLINSGITEKQALEMWMKLIGKNYL